LLPDLPPYAPFPEKREDDKPQKGTEPSMSDFLSLSEIEAEAANTMSKKGWAYYVSGSDDALTKSLNNTVYRSVLFRPRIFVDVTNVSLNTTFLGHAVNAPFFVSPAAMATLAHADGEKGIAAACAKFGVLQIISNNAAMSPEAIVADSAPDQVFGFQLYVQVERAKSQQMLARIAQLPQIKFIALTVDAPAPGKRELDMRLSKGPDDDAGQAKAHVQLKPAATPSAVDVAAAGIGEKLFAGTDAGLTWETTLAWLKEHTELPIVLKGITTFEDAAIAAQHKQVKGILLSNHGGRALDGAPPALHTLMEIRKYAPEVLEKLEVWVDGGVTRGTDVVKALCLGARGVGIGRAPLWGLAIGGAKGVERTFESELILLVRGIFI
jgi:L-lactate dehydrogenase (cytochrome)